MPQGKPFDIRDRTFAFARDVLRAYPPNARQHVPSNEVWRQLIRAAGSVGANVEEAQASSSRPDLRFRMKVALRECRETQYWLRLIPAAALHGTDSIDALQRESSELVAILTTIVKRLASESNS